MWHSLLTRHCQAQIKCGKWRRLDGYNFIPYIHCWHCQSRWRTIATDSKKSAGHSLLLVTTPFSLHFEIDSHDSRGSSVLTAAKINAHMVAGVTMVGTEYSQEAGLFNSVSSK